MGKVADAAFPFLFICATEDNHEEISNTCLPRVGVGNLIVWRCKNMQALADVHPIYWFSLDIKCLFDFEDRLF